MICPRLCACLCSVLPPHNGAHDSLRRAREVAAGGVGSKKLPLSVASAQRKAGDEHVYARKQENSFFLEEGVFFSPLTSPEINMLSSNQSQSSKRVAEVSGFFAAPTLSNILKLLRNETTTGGTLML